MTSGKKNFDIASKEIKLSKTIRNYILKKFIVTGGYGFIGSALIRRIINFTNHKVLNVDKLTYAGSLDSLLKIKNNINFNKC